MESFVRREREIKHPERIIEGNLFYDKLLQTGLVDSSFKIMNAQLNDDYNIFLETEDIKEKINFLRKNINENYIGPETWNNLGRDCYNGEKFYLSAFLKSIIFHLVNIFAHDQENKELENIIEQLKTLYAKLIEPDFEYGKDNGLRNENRFFEIMKNKLMEKFGDKFYILRSSKFDDYANGIDFIIYYRDLELKKDIPMACIDLGNSFRKKLLKGEERIRNINDYLYHDYNNEDGDIFKKTIRRNMPIFCLDFENSKDCFLELVKILQKELPKIKKINHDRNFSKIKYDYLKQLERITGILFSSLEKSQKANILNNE